MNLTVRDIDFAQKRLVLDVEGPLSETCVRKLQRYLRHCREQGLADIVLCRPDNEPLADDVVDRLKENRRLRIQTCTEKHREADDRINGHAFRKLSDTRPALEYLLRLTDLERALDYVGQFVLVVGHSIPLPPLPLSRTRLCLTELTANSIDHAEFGDTQPLIEITLRIADDSIGVEYRDNGTEFDITEKPAVDIGEKIRTNSKRGLGLHMLRTMTEELQYDRENKQNRTRFKIKIHKTAVTTEG
jgi:anti-sigma regulatory factor (Ser/Thr protein kinase)